MFSLCNRNQINPQSIQLQESVFDLEPKHMAFKAFNHRSKGIQRIEQKVKRKEGYSSVELMKQPEIKKVKKAQLSVGRARHTEINHHDVTNPLNKSKDLEQTHKMVPTPRPSTFLLTNSAPIKLASSIHTPHRLLRKANTHHISEFQQNLTSIQYEYTSDNLFSPIAISLKHHPQQKQSSPLLNFSTFLQKTKKIQPLYQPKPYNPRQSIETYHIKSYLIDSPSCSPNQELSQGIFLPQQTRTTLNEGGMSPRKRQLQDAKSIISREDESLSRLDEIKLQESILLNRQIDMFQFITPLDEITQCQMASAVDRKDHSLVTLKVFRNQGERHFKELESIRKIQGYKTQQSQFQTLQFKQIFIEQTFLQKKIIFVFQPFQKTMTSYLHFLPSQSQERLLFQEKVKKEVKKFIQTLNTFKLELTQEPIMEDFVMIDSDWKFHNYAKIGPVRGKNVSLETLWNELKMIKGSS